MSCDVRPPELELKNAKGLSYDKLEKLQTELDKLARARCGEVRNEGRFALIKHSSDVTTASDQVISALSGDDL